MAIILVPFGEIQRIFTFYEANNYIYFPLLESQILISLSLPENIFYPSIEKQTLLTDELWP